MTQFIDTLDVYKRQVKRHSFSKKCNFVVDHCRSVRYNNQRRRTTDRQEQMECAAVAHLVERHLAKVEVASSSLVGRSICGKSGQEL